MADKATQLDSPPANVPGLLRQIGNAYGQVNAAVNLWTVSDEGIQLTVDSEDAVVAVELPVNNGAISIVAGVGRLRFALGDADVLATATSNLIQANDSGGERLEFLLRAGQTHISIIGDAGVTAATLDVMGLGDEPPAV